jgi:glutamyl-tRNA synthetase
MPGLKPRAKTLVELMERAYFYVAPRPLVPAADATKALTGEARATLGALAANLTDVEWQNTPLEAALRDFAGAHGVKLGAVAQPLRAALTGSLASPGIFEVMEVLGREESLGRIADAANGAS